MNESNIQSTDTEAMATAETPLVVATPRWNTRRNDNGVEARIDLPGVGKENVNIETSANRLRLTARRKRPAGTLVAGRDTPDSYELEFKLGRGLDTAKVSARFENGVLILDFPLLEAVKPRQIEIS